MSLSARYAGVIASVLTLLTGILWWWMDQIYSGAFWADYTTPVPTLTYFCERTLVDHFIRQPTNTYTNLGYLWVGVYILLRGSKGPDSFLHRYPIYAWLYGLLCLYTCFGSAYFHASLALLPEQIDLSAVYGITALPLLYALHHYLQLRGRSYSAWPFLLVWGLWMAWASIFTWEMRAHFVIPAFVGGAAVLLFLVRKSQSVPSRWYYALGFCIQAGLSFFWFDIARVGCFPDAVLHPHGLWHLSAAGGAFAFYGYMRRIG